MRIVLAVRDPVALIALIALVPLSSSALAEPYRAPLDWKRDSGIAGELSLGYGGMTALVGDHSGRSSSNRALWLDAAIGTTLVPKLAAEFRIAGVTPIENAGPQVTAGFVGPCLRVTEIGTEDSPLWESIGLGAALAIDHATSDVRVGLGWDMRLGYLLTTGSEHAVSLTLGLTLARYGAIWLTSYGLAVGYHRR